MTAVTECAIHGKITGLRTKHREDLVDHNRSMRPRRRLTACLDLGNFVAITFRRVLLVFFGELPRVRSSISRTSLVFPGIHQRVVFRSPWRSASRIAPGTEIASMLLRDEKAKRI